MKHIIAITLFLFSLSSIAQTKGNFPTLSGHTLDGNAVTLPLAGTKKFTIVGICYKRSAEDDLKTWIQPMYDVFVAKASGTDYFDVGNYYDVNYYFIPLISGFKKAAADFKASTQPDLWKNVIDCDTDIALLKVQLKPSDEGIPYFYVIDTAGKIVEVVSRKYSENKMDKIQDAID
ncbi:MAG: hypothetical protein K0S26_176 [Bacteroidota bacterium]|jgi:hypothetical protein|nr:hypothetical protein [Bacteroidota bacterium]